MVHHVSDTSHEAFTAKGVAERVAHGGDETVAYDGISQYAAGGASACGLASLNFARVVLERQKATGTDEVALLRAMVDRECMMEIISVCRQWPQNLHSEIEDLLQAPIFQHTLKEVTCHYGTPNFDKFNDLLKDLENVCSAARSCSVAVITRPPEIIACARTSKSFIVFDSHSRQDHPNGAGLFLSQKREHIARHLHNLLYVDPTLYAGSGFQWQAQLLSNFSAHIFVSHGIDHLSTPALTTALLECSLELLKLRAQVVDLDSQRESSTESMQRLEDEMEAMQMENSDLKEKNAYLERKSKQLSSVRHPPPSSTLHSQTWATTSQAQSSESPRTLASILSAKAPSLPGPSKDKGKRRAEEDIDKSMNLAFQLQQQFDAEAEQMAADRKIVESSAQSTFDCIICLETHPIDYAAYISGCKHTTCRECLRQHIITTLRDHRYPIFCPACVGDAPKAEITQDVLFDLGIPEKEYSIYEESQLSILSILIHCRKCKEGVFVDRGEYNEAKILACPLPNCTHAWCKSCHHTIVPSVDGPPHSCDGSSELQHLMNKQGWKHCPGCKTPVAKDSGCNHMTCMSPGCNTHFCYICGEAIIRSALRGDIRNAVSSHYRRCTLFAVPQDTR
ncbi:hypothetical protein CYLTODRAFT_383163 [Cylindrobasidium torrendii FP15055 ss-10]|uniref:RBR-type E3 ubiquitin transferase n=1 Tax=Cylindrobasidium torrendii FP15055 ss-10 TaxID=1314674 RepID=A0A0D7AZX6_9AGAR|nr:hypothetical protein CYLTODRAFT_383163 [Cylindrobasidium torrendii FP15055 ss-10]